MDSRGSQEGAAGFPAAPGDVSADFLTEALRRAGVLEGASVVELSFEPIGAGMVGDSVRYHPRYDRDGAGPATVAAKFAAEDPTSRQTAIALGLYSKEVRFYDTLSKTLAVRTPEAYFAAFDEASGEFLLLLEDLAPARGGNQLAGCSLADAKAALREAAALHGPRWCDPRLAELDFLDRSAIGVRVGAAFPAVLAEFRRRYETILEPQYMAVCDAFAERIGDYYNRPLDRFCVMHGDFRLDNMLFDIRGGSEPCGILDWQTCGLGQPMTDVGYFLGAGIPIALRQAHEADLLNFYLDELARHGVTDYDRDLAWEDYRHGLFHGLVMAVFATASVERTERGDEMFLSMARGACQLAIDADGLAAL